MPYKFTFDLSKIPLYCFNEITKVGYQRGLHRKVGTSALHMIKKFKIQEATGLNLSDAVVLLQDLIDLNARNIVNREKFVKTKKRVLLLPHCSRKFMDNMCQAKFDPAVPSYFCAHCSQDCLVNKATTLAQSKGYDVYVLPGGSCIPKIVKTKGYEGVVGIACGEETRMSGRMLEDIGVTGQAVPLIKNGCASTVFNFETLTGTL